MPLIALTSEHVVCGMKTGGGGGGVGGTGGAVAEPPPPQDDMSMVASTINAGVRAGIWGVGFCMLPVIESSVGCVAYYTGEPANRLVV